MLQTRCAPSRSVLRPGLPALLLVLVSSITVAIAQELPPADGGQQMAPAPLSITVEGVSESRFNPTYGTVFFTVSGGDLADAGRDARITADDRPLAPTRTSYSNRIVAGTYELAPGPHRLAMSGWDGIGQAVVAEARVWTGELPMLVVVTDSRGEPVTGASVVVSLDQQPGVRASQSTRDGLASFGNLPDERLRVEVTSTSGDKQSRVVQARQAVVEFRLRP